MGLYTAALRPLLFAFPAETAHHASLFAARFGLGLAPARALTRACLRVSDPRLAQTVFGQSFANPVGRMVGSPARGKVRLQARRFRTGWPQRCSARPAAAARRRWDRSVTAGISTRTGPRREQAVAAMCV